VSALGHARAGARRYAALLALPGARRPVIASAVGSMPIGMFGLAVLLLAQDATGSFAVAGRVEYRDVEADELLGSTDDGGMTFEVRDGLIVLLAPQATAADALSRSDLTEDDLLLSWD